MVSWKCADGSIRRLGEITQVVTATDEYAIYYMSDGQLDYQLDVDDARRAAIATSEFYAQQGRLFELVFLINQLKTTHLPPQIRAMRASLGRCLVFGFEGHTQLMADALDKLKRVLDGKLGRTARQIYVQTTIRWAASARCS